MEKVKVPADLKEFGSTYEGRVKEKKNKRQKSEVDANNEQRSRYILPFKLEEQVENCLAYVMVQERL